VAHIASHAFTCTKVARVSRPALGQLSAQSPV